MRRSVAAMPGSSSTLASEHARLSVNPSSLRTFRLPAPVYRPALAVVRPSATAAPLVVVGTTSGHLSVFSAVDGLSASVGQTHGLGTVSAVVVGDLWDCGQLHVVAVTCEGSAFVFFDDSYHRPSESPSHSPPLSASSTSHTHPTLSPHVSLAIDTSSSLSPAPPPTLALPPISASAATTPRAQMFGSVSDTPTGGGAGGVASPAGGTLPPTSAHLAPADSTSTLGTPTLPSDVSQPPSTTAATPHPPMTTPLSSTSRILSNHVTQMVPCNVVCMSLAWLSTTDGRPQRGLICGTADKLVFALAGLSWPDRTLTQLWSLSVAGHPVSMSARSAALTESDTDTGTGTGTGTSATDDPAAVVFVGLHNGSVVGISAIGTVVETRTASAWKAASDRSTGRGRGRADSGGAGASASARVPPPVVSGTVTSGGAGTSTDAIAAASDGAKAPRPIPPDPVPVISGASGTGTAGGTGTKSSDGRVPTTVLVTTLGVEEPSGGTHPEQLIVGGPSSQAVVCSLSSRPVFAAANVLRRLPVFHNLVGLDTLARCLVMCDNTGLVTLHPLRVGHRSVSFSVKADVHAFGCATYPGSGFDAPPIHTFVFVTTGGRLVVATFGPELFAPTASVKPRLLSDALAATGSLKRALVAAENVTGVADDGQDPDTKLVALLENLAVARAQMQAE